MTDIVKDFNRKFRIINNYIKKLADPKETNSIRLMFVTGDPGSGKSHTITKMVKAAGAPKITMITKTTPSAFAKALYENSAPGSIMIADDADASFFNGNTNSGTATIDLLKNAFNTNPSGCGTINYDSPKQPELSTEMVVNPDTGKKEKVVTYLPTEFDCYGALIIITNLPLRQFKKESKLNVHLEAIKSRGVMYDFEMDTLDERTKWTEHALNTTEFKDTHLITKEEINQMGAFIAKYKQLQDNLSPRLIVKMKNSMGVQGPDWKYDIASQENFTL